MNYRHARGRGFVLDNGDVSRAAFISRDSVVTDRALVRDAKLLNQSCAAEDCRILGGTLDRGYVGGRTVVAGDAFIGEQSIIRCKTVCGRARVTRSRLEGIVEVYDGAEVDQVYLHEGVLVYGNARLWGPFIVGGFARIDRGTWMRAPRVIDLEHAYITESIGGVLVECRYHTFDWWLRFGKKLGRKAGWTEAQIEETYAAIAEWAANDPVYQIQTVLE